MNDDKDKEHLRKINEKWDELRELAEKEVKNPPENDFNIPSINIKWLSIRSDWLSALIKLEIERDKIERDLTRYYRLEHNLKLDKAEMALFIRTDERYVKMYEKCKRISGLLQFIEGVLKAIENRYYLVKEYNIRQRYLKGSLD